MRIVLTLILVLTAGLAQAATITVPAGTVLVTPDGNRYDIPDGSMLVTPDPMPVPPTAPIYDPWPVYVPNPMPVPPTTPIYDPRPVYVPGSNFIVNPYRNLDATPWIFYPSWYHRPYFTLHRPVVTPMPRPFFPTPPRPMPPRPMPPHPAPGPHGGQHGGGTRSGSHYR